MVAVNGVDAYPFMAFSHLTCQLEVFLFFFNCDSPYARLNSHYEAWSYKKKKTQKRLQDTENLFTKNLQLKDVC